MTYEDVAKLKDVVAKMEEQKNYQDYSNKKA